MQVLSVIGSLVTMACVAGNYQRFESQHIVGSRQYPWSSRRQIAWRRQRLLKRTEPLPPVARGSGYTEVPASEHVLRRFAAAESTSRTLVAPSSLATKSLHLGEFNLDDSDSSADENSDNRKIRSFLRQRSVESNQDTVDMDFTPSAEAPPPPSRFALAPPIELGLPAIMNRMSTYKDMVLLRTELYLLEHVPRLSPNFHLQPTTKTANDHVDPNTSRVIDVEQPPALPTRRQLIDGLEQDDFLGKAVSTAAWSLVLLQRMLALSAFAYFHPLACLILCTAHYLLMLAALLAETRLHTKAERVMFYLFLAYVYIFCIVELKVKFRRPRRTLIAYAVLLMVQNVVMSVWWFGRREYGRLATTGLDTDEAATQAADEVSASSTWWFGFMFAAVMLSGVYALLCWMVYYFLLKPSARVLYAAEQEKRRAAEAGATVDGTGRV